MKHSNTLIRILAPVGYAWGIALAISGTALFFFSGMIDHALAQQSFMRIHPLYSGAEVVKTDSTGEADWRIHRPVFDGLVSERSHGFIQIDVICKNHETNSLTHDIDYNSDGTPDFTLTIPPNQNDAPMVLSKSPSITTVERFAKTRDGWIVRVGLDKSPQAR